jgi:copper transport protein
VGRVSRRGWRVAAAVGLAAVAATVLAGPADAHAVLLRTDPGPLAVAARAPGAVRLGFSEAVEASPGWIRVLDVSGRRVDRGAPISSNGGLTITQPLSQLTDGTYRVSWRAVSADSHPVQGG